MHEAIHTYTPPRCDDDDSGEDIGIPFQDMLNEAQRMLGQAFANAQQQRGRRQQQSGTPNLDKFSTDLTAKARDGELDPVVGRDTEIRRMTEVLCRRKKNNPVLIGEPGVGKSAIVEGLAQRIASGDASPVLYGKRLVSLDITGLVAGTRYRGDFEERIKNLIEELEHSDDVIVFIDEIHNIIGAGGASGSMDVANILKPALARGTIQCIGATTLDEYRKSIERDGALERRFQKIVVQPTSVADTLHILENVKEHYQQFHHVTYSPEAIEACVRQAGRYITERQFPDKAIDAMDEAGARVRLRTATVPHELRELEQELDALLEAKAAAVESQDFERAAQLRDHQNALTQRIDELRHDPDRARRHKPAVTERDVNDVIALMTGVPVQRLSQSETSRLKQLATRLRATVIGQDEAVQTVTRCIQRNRLGLRDERRPVGAFLFLGPTGVGKTYLAKQIALQVFGTEEALIRVDMSEYNESFNTSRLVGAPPGYVGYDEGGQLTERVRRRPYSVVLLDEIEKAHANVYNLLLQVLDEGRLTDGNGRLIDFRNTIIIMTSNTGSRQLKDFGRGVGFQLTDGDAARQKGIIDKALRRQFAPEFLNRLDEIVMFQPLSEPSMRKIIDIELRSLIARVEALGYKLQITAPAKALVARSGYDPQFGARPLKRAIQQMLEDGVCNVILNEKPKAGDTIKVSTARGKDELAFVVKGTEKADDRGSDETE